MRLIRSNYKIITPINGENILKEIEIAARTCYKSEGKIEYAELPNGMIDLPNGYAESARVLIPKLIARGHEAMLEFGGMITVKFICDRGVSHELVRHRVASFAQESTRYCNYSKDDHITFIIPNWINDIEDGSIYNLTYDFDKGMTEDTFHWAMTMLQSEYHYNHLMQNQGWSAQQARSVLPNSLKTEINVSANIREWRHIFKLRTSKAAHPQMIELMIPLLIEFKQRIPILFNDITY